MKIEEEIKQLEAQIEAAEQRIKQLKNECSHPGELRRVNYRSDTNNWSKADDCYWVEIDCGKCGKHWSLDSDLWSWAYRDPRGAVLPKNV